MMLFFVLTIICVSFNIFLISYIGEEKRYGLKKVDIYFYLIFSIYWMIFDLLFKLGYDGKLSFIISRGTSFFWQSIPFIIMHLSYSVLGKNKDFLYKLFLFLVVISIFITYSTHLVIDSPIIVSGVYTSTYGVLHMKVVILVVILPFLRIISLYIKRRDTLNEKAREQYLTILTGIFSTFIVALSVDVFSDYFFPDYVMPHIAALSSITFSLCIFIAVKNYSFLGPEISQILNSLFHDVNYDLIVVDSEINPIKTGWILKKDIDDDMYKSISEKIKEVRKKLFQEFSTIISKKDNKNNFFRLDFFPCYLENTFIGGLVFLNNITGDYHFMKDIKDSFSELEKIEQESSWELNKNSFRLNSSSKKFREILYNISEPIVVFDIDSGMITDVNRSFIDLYKIDSLEDNTHVSDIVNLGEKKDVSKMEMLEEISHKLLRQKNSEGRTFYVEVLTFKVAKKVILLLKDYTNIIEFENSIIRKERVAISALIAGSFVSEFKKMHKKIDDLLQSILSEHSQKTELKELLKRVKNASLKSDRILNQLNTFSSLEINPSLVNINKLVRDEIEDLNILIKQNKTEIIKKVEGNIMIECDEDSIAMVIKNLIINALHALKNVERPVLKISTGIKGNRFYISVKDNGVGIKEEDISKVFRPFYTNRTSVIGKDPGTIEGTGLGLSVCEMIIKKHNGEIELESEYNKGSEFIVWLPV